MELEETQEILGIEDPFGLYKSIERPVLPKHANTVSGSKCKDAPLDNSGSDSDLQEGEPKSKQARHEVTSGRFVTESMEDGGGEAFKEVTKTFHEDRNKNVKVLKSKKNNVWSSLLQEESLNSEMSGVEVRGRGRSLKSDRGAETYDYRLVSKEKRKERLRSMKELKKKERSSLDDEMDTYWQKNNDQDSNSMEEDGIQCEEKIEVNNYVNKIEDESELKTVSRKRSMKDRLGDRVKLDTYKNKVLPPPGEPRQIPDMAEESLIEGTDEEFGQELAMKLDEEKEDMLVNLVKTLKSRKFVLDYFKKTQEVEAKGGLTTSDGARRRTSGGVLLYLIKKTEDPAIIDKVKTFCKMLNKEKRSRKFAVVKKKKNFMNENLNKYEEESDEKESSMIEETVKEEDDFDGCIKQEDDNETDIQELPNILAIIANSFGGKKEGNQTDASVLEDILDYD